MNRLSIWLAAAALSAPAPALGAVAAMVSPPRAAIVVGATAPVPGRPALRHAHRDAATMAEVLVSVGNFARAQVHVLHDPEPAVLLAAVEREASALADVPGAMLLFYYSGHAGEGALFTAGKRLEIEVLRRALDRPDVSVRVGVIDACEGGGWTRAKGLVPGAPFEVTLPPVLASEGSALIASSSGEESAHESDALGGSFFTHYLVAALRGAADDGRHGEVTLRRAFEYARDQTIRETARHASGPQHPSFALNLKGRQDIVLANVAASPSTLAVDQTDGPLEVVHLRSGLRMVQLPPGARSVVLAVPPGGYLVRKLAPDGVRALEVSVPREGAAYVREYELVLVGSERLAVKGAPEAAPTVAPAWPRRGGGELEIGLETTEQLGADYVGIGTGDDAGVGGMVRLDGRIGITDRLVWKIGTLAFAYRLGESGGVEVVPYAGLLSWKLPYRGDTNVPNLGGFYRGEREYRLGAGLGTRMPFSVGALVLTLGADVATIGHETGSRLYGGVGVTIAAGSMISFHVSAGVIRQEFPGLVVVSGSTTLENYGGSGTAYWVGSSQEFGLASIPVIRVGPWNEWSIDLYGGGEEYRRVWWRLGVARAF